MCIRDRGRRSRIRWTAWGCARPEDVLFGEHERIAFDAVVGIVDAVFERCV